MIKEYNRRSFYFGVPGVLIQGFGYFAEFLNNNRAAGAGQPMIRSSVFFLIGSIFLLIGLMYYAKAKGRNPAWSLLGFLSIIGIIILALLPDKSEQVNS